MNKYKVTSYARYVRPEPGMNNQPIGAVNKDDVVELMEVSKNGYWLKIKTEEGLVGWCAGKYLMRIQPKEEIVGEEFRWMPIALREIGVQEWSLPGKHNPRILEYLQSTTLDSNLSSKDETPWCSAYVNWCIEQAGYAGTDSAWARHWMNWGKSIDMPRRGSITILERNQNGGHVGFFIKETGDKIMLLGGNQSNSVRKTLYSKSKLLGYRIPF